MVGGDLTNNGTVHVIDNAHLMVGGITINNGVMNLDIAGTMSLKSITGSGTMTVGGIYNTQVTASYVCLNTQTIKAGSTLVISADLSGPTAGLSMSAVPEPSTIVMLIIAAMGLILAAWRRR